MDNDNSVVDEIFASASRGAVVVIGPAGVGKTWAVLEMYRRCDGKCLLIAPNVRGAEYLRDKLLSDSPNGVVVSPQVVTFASLAGRILAQAGQSAKVRPLSALRRRLLLRRIVDELRKEGKLSALTAVADTPGLIVTLDRAISELKRSAVEPQALADVIGTSEKGKTRDLLEIYNRYQGHLLDTGMYDSEGRMWLARDCLKNGAYPAGIDAVAVDGFIDFTPTQLDILKLLSRKLQRVVITLPWADDGRERMWQWTNRTLNNIRKAFGDDLETVKTKLAANYANGANKNNGEEFGIEDKKGDSPLLKAKVWDSVFDFGAESRDSPDGVSVIAAGTIEAEVSTVARRVKRLLIDGATAGSIAIVARSMEVYRSEIERIFAEHDIPVAPTAKALTSIPIIRFAMDVASLGPGFEFRDVLRVIKNSYFRPQALGDFDESIVSAAETLICQGNILGGRAAYAKAASRLEKKGTVPFLAAGEMLERLFEIADLSDLGRIASKLQLQAAACEHGDVELIARDLRALSALNVALGQLDSSKPSASQLYEALSVVECPPARGESLVEVMDVLDGRAIRREHVFLMGLGEGGFPSKFVENSLIGEAQRIAWSQRGIMLDSRNDLTAREMLLFYMAVSRANTTLTLSYLSADASGSSGEPGSFLLSLLEPFGGVEGVPIERIPLGRFLPPVDEIACPRDAFNAAIAGLFHEKKGTVPFLGAKVEIAARGLWAFSRRWRRGECDVFDGRISDAGLIEKLGERFSDSAVYSARQFDMFGQCPWWFFATDILRLTPPTEPERMLEAVGRGLFCHAVLCTMFRRLRDGCSGPVVLSKLDESRIMSALDQAIESEAKKIESANPPYPMLWEVQKEQMHQQLRDYVAVQQEGDELSARSLYFEFAFGIGPEATGQSDESSVADPVEIDTPVGPVLLRGRIDRVDRVHIGGSDGLLVVDYKTGRLPGVKDIDAGRNLQAPLYKAAAERIFNEECFGGAFHRIGGDQAESYFAPVKRRGGGFVADKTFEDRSAAAMEKVGMFVESMRSGRFDLNPSSHCPSYCPFRRICHYSQARAELKSQGGEQ